ncbi:MAG: histidinol-phosphate transaminase [Fusobacterium sp. JB021]|nr:histidinol-phosphate transaminase [Fusobacterium sp. JB020]MDP0494362.1 histidinol-phosphate transaminase [Fusobacterium sp. JB021]MDP0506714.1 histidinol-phosphate transaminase [Fusobacterium sp. JB019]
MDLHGGNIYKLLRRGEKNILDYSSNINPLGVPESLKKSIIENFEILEKYPDINYIELRESIGKYNKISKENILVGNGATEILFLYMKALKPKKVIIVSPTFAEYERSLKTFDIEIDFFPLKEEENFILDIEKLKNKGKDYDLVVLCNPNNPTGTFIEKNKLLYLNNYLKKFNTNLFIDECFIEFVKDWEDNTLIDLKSENIFILRALTKFFALPGIRLGYGLTYDSHIIKKIEEIREPWSVNAFADLAGKVILKDEKYISATKKWILEEKIWFYKELGKIEKLKVYKTHSNFILVKLKTMSSENFCKLMEKKAVLVRNASNFRFLDNKYVRLAIKDREKNEKVLKIIKEVLK